ncbi:MAG: NAD-dependent epimerase/dehydratase family protein, partial [Acidimicrobiales bacterium]
MRILVMGGTQFLGRAIVDCALEAGHDITLFNRGKTNAGLYPDVESILGDRDIDLAELHGRRFDAVVDTSAYYPRQVRAVVETLESRFDHYTFVSSVSVYADNDTPDADETADLLTVEDVAVESDADYGGFKALCEQELD